MLEGSCLSSVLCDLGKLESLLHFIQITYSMGISRPCTISRRTTSSGSSSSYGSHNNPRSKEDDDDMVVNSGVIGSHVELLKTSCMLLCLSCLYESDNTQLGKSTQKMLASLTSHI